MAQSNLFDQIQIRGYVDGWARFTIEKWQKELRKKNISVTDELYRSFEREIRRKGAEITEVVLKFKMYGRFVDMGVGNGVKAFERASNATARRDSRKYGLDAGHVNRTNKRWINKIKTAQTYRLSEILGARSAQALISNFNNTNNITVNING